MAWVDKFYWPVKKNMTALFNSWKLVANMLTINELNAFFLILKAKNQTKQCQQYQYSQ